MSDKFDWNNILFKNEGKSIDNLSPLLSGTHARVLCLSRKGIANFPERLRWNNTEIKTNSNAPQERSRLYCNSCSFPFLCNFSNTRQKRIYCVWKYITRLRWPACIKNNPKFIHVYFPVENYSLLFFDIREVTCGSCVATFFMHVMYMKQQVYWNDKQSDNFFGPPARRFALRALLL